MNIPDGLLFTKEHEWVKIEGKRAKMGITDYAQHSLGDITFIELPGKGKTCRQFKQMATVESVKAASDVYASLSGNVVEVNETIVRQPELVNQSPYEQGWFVVIELSDEKEKDNLMNGDAYRNYVKGLAQ
ncbi:MAG: glycine cleavage system protein GcvH [Candidatus Omnitrophica bacterium]|jgi:glycine cleavage system H protein|nr:glycine cleavage system protein GcvH [Candidatus Omnitrophota bacterium]